MGAVLNVASSKAAADKDLAAARNSTGEDDSCVHAFHPVSPCTGSPPDDATTPSPGSEGCPFPRAPVDDSAGAAGCRQPAQAHSPTHMRAGACSNTKHAGLPLVRFFASATFRAMGFLFFGNATPEIFTRSARLSSGLQVFSPRTPSPRISRSCPSPSPSTASALLRTLPWSCPLVIATVFLAPTVPASPLSSRYALPGPPPAAYSAPVSDPRS